MAQKLMHIGVLSFSVMSGAIYAIIGFIAGLLMVLFMGMFLAAIPRAGLPMAGGFGIMAIIGYSIISGIMGFICAAIFAIIYNFLAPKIGGIEVELK